MSIFKQNRKEEKKNQLTLSVVICSNVTVPGPYALYSFLNHDPIWIKKKKKNL